MENGLETAAVPAGADRTAGTTVVRLTIPAKAEYVTLCRLALTGLARVRPFTDEELADLKLALTEAASNSVRHAYGGSEGNVEVVYELLTDRIAIEVSDDGEGFDPRREARSDDGELSEGGLGIAIIGSVADELELETAPGSRGSRLRFVKRLTK